MPALLPVQFLARFSYMWYVNFYELESQVVGANNTPGLLRFLWLPGLAAHARKPTRRDNAIMIADAVKEDFLDVPIHTVMRARTAFHKASAPSLP